jgi:hypothetical protein
MQDFKLSLKILIRILVILFDLLFVLMWYQEKHNMQGLILQEIKFLTKYMTLVEAAVGRKVFDCFFSDSRGSDGGVLIIEQVCATVENSNKN